MAGNRQISKLEDMAFDALLKQGIFSVDMPASTTSAYQQKVASVIENKYLEWLHERLMLTFLQAVVDDDRKKVAQLLDNNPELLLLKATKGLEIESQYTWLKIDAENESALSVAAKRKQIKMIELILPFYGSLEQTEEVVKAKIDALSAWKDYDIHKNASGEDEIVIPREYAIYAGSLIDVFKEDTYPNGKDGKFSERTENALESLFKLLLPKKAVKLDDYLDPELFLLALYKAYSDKFGSPFDPPPEWVWRDAFSLRIIGLVQGVLIPETAKIVCQGLYGVVRDGVEITARAELLKLLEDESFENVTFYRTSRESLFGLSREFFCGLWGARRTFAAERSDFVGWKNHVEQKQQLYGALRSKCIDCQSTISCRS